MSIHTIKSSVKWADDPKKSNRQYLREMHRENIIWKGMNGAPFKMTVIESEDYSRLRWSVFDSSTIPGVELRRDRILPY